MSLNSETYEVTINRADSIMVRRIGADWFEITPKTLVKLILFGLRNELLEHRMITGQVLGITDIKEINVTAILRQRDEYKFARGTAYMQIEHLSVLSKELWEETNLALERLRADNTT